MLHQAELFLDLSRKEKVSGLEEINPYALHYCLREVGGNHA